MPLPGLLAFASLSLGTRSIPVVASVVLHAGIAAGLVATAAVGHARPGLAARAAEMTVDVETPETVPVPPVAPVLQAAPDVLPPTHTHAYPVDPSHDARPHDPAMHHDHDDHASAPAAPAAPALVAEAPEASTRALPRFDLSTGSGAPLGAHVAAQGTNAGTNTGSSASPPPSAPADDVVHAASAVQVSARLVQSVAAAYPVHARSDEVEGDVGVEIVVDREGRVVDARVTRPAGHGFDDAALAAVRAYRFSPAQREGRAVRVRMPWSVQFRLR